MRPMSGSSSTWPVMTAVTASVAPRASEPGVAHEDLGRVDVEPEEGEQRADDERAQHGQVGLPEGEGDDHVAREGEDQRAAGEAVEAVGDVDRVAGGHDGEGGDEDEGDGMDVHRAEEGHRQLVDLVGVLDLPGRDAGHDRLPQQLLDGADAVAGARVEPVVGGAQDARRAPASPSARRWRHRRSRRRTARSRRAMPSTTRPR